MTHRFLFFAIELNLILWLIAAYRTGWDVWVVAGLVLAAAVQHWAYYVLVKGGASAPGGS